MHTKRTSRNARALILTECVIAVSILILLLSGFWYSLATFRAFNHIQMTRLRCTAAAEAQLDSLTATGEEIDGATVQTLWPGVTLHVTRTVGEGQWKGLEQLAIQATAEAAGKNVRMDFSRYLHPIAGRAK